MSGDARAPAAATRGSNDPHDLPIEFELNLGMRQETRPLSDVDRDGHLSFGRDAHDSYSYL
jgi:hypothetical protein